MHDEASALLDLLFSSPTVLDLSCKSCSSRSLECACGTANSTQSDALGAFPPTEEKHLSVYRYIEEARGPLQLTTNGQARRSLLTHIDFLANNEEVNVETELGFIGLEKQLNSQFSRYPFVVLKSISQENDRRPKSKYDVQIYIHSRALWACLTDALTTTNVGKEHATAVRQIDGFWLMDKALWLLVYLRSFQRSGASPDVASQLQLLVDGLLLNEVVFKGLRIPASTVLSYTVFQGFQEYDYHPRDTPEIDSSEAVDQYNGPWQMLRTLFGNGDSAYTFSIQKVIALVTGVETLGKPQLNRTLRRTLAGIRKSGMFKEQMKVFGRLSFNFQRPRIYRIAHHTRDEALSVPRRKSLHVIKRRDVSGTLSFNNPTPLERHNSNPRRPRIGSLALTQLGNGHRKTIELSNSWLSQQNHTSITAIGGPIMDSRRTLSTPCLPRYEFERQDYVSPSVEEIAGEEGAIPGLLCPVGLLRSQEMENIPESTTFNIPMYSHSPRIPIETPFLSPTQPPAPALALGDCDGRTNPHPEQPEIGIVSEIHASESPDTSSTDHRQSTNFSYSPPAREHSSPVSREHSSPVSADEVDPGKAKNSIVECGSSPNPPIITPPQSLSSDNDPDHTAGEEVSPSAGSDSTADRIATTTPTGRTPRPRKRRRTDILARHTCERCGEHFTTVANFNRHNTFTNCGARVRDRNDVVYTCGWCERTYNRQDNKVKHERDKHGAGKIWVL